METKRSAYNKQATAAPTNPNTAPAAASKWAAPAAAEEEAWEEAAAVEEAEDDLAAEVVSMTVLLCMVDEWWTELVLEYTTEVLWYTGVEEATL